MSEISTTEYDFLGDLFAARTMQDYQDLVVPFCSELFSAQNILSIRYHLTGPPEILFHWIPDDQLRSTFEHNYNLFGYLLDPFYKLALETEDWTACPLREIAPDRFETSDYFAGYFGSTKMVDELGFVARIDPETVVHLSLGRNSGSRRFRAHEVAKFRALSKVLVPALKAVVHDPIPSRVAIATSLEHRFHALSRQQGQEISPREAEVATLIVQGHSSRAIGLKLSISGHTVKAHRRNLYKKLNISSRSDLFGLLAAFVNNPPV